MKDIYKNPILYYILVPIMVVLWPLLVWAVYLPDAEENWQDDKDQYNEAQKIIEEILNIDPDRLAFVDSKTSAAEFDYANVVDRVATSCKISSTNYELSAKPARTSKGQKTQSCHVELKQVDITRFARFLSTIQLRWANLQCENVTLTKGKDRPDTWKVDLDFKYYY
jgi:hypothetical protein